MYVYDDGTIGATWTIGMNPSAFADRGTGYNYFDGTSWQPWSTARIESQRTGWPSYAPFGVNGEIIVAHYSGTSSGVKGLVFSKRTNKEIGDWAFFDFHSPEPAAEYLWPRITTSGVDHSIIHVLALTMPVANGGIVYHGLNGALLYSRSTDGGETWDIHHQILPGMDSTQYNGFTGDCYALAEPKDNIVAFVVGSNKTDMFLMKSTDHGQTFEKTIIWDNPYDTILPADTLYCVDGSMAVAVDAVGKVHVVFGITSLYYDTQWHLNREVDGIGYWNEDRETFSSNLNALNPSGGSGSEMVPDYNLIGWTQDINGDGVITYNPYNSFGYCTSFSVSSMVQLVIDDQNRLFLVFTSVTETYDNGIDNYRRLWSRSSLDGGETWGKFYHFFANDNSTVFNEYAFPSCAVRSDEYIHLLAMIDIEPGIYNCPSENFDENRFQYIKVLKDEIVGINQDRENTGFQVYQNSPNPFSQTTTVKVIIEKPAQITLEVLNLLGQKVLQTQTLIGKQGVNHITIEKNSLPPGIYFYTVQSGEQTITKKMIIEY
jgi:hypothetical protein